MMLHRHAGPAVAGSYAAGAISGALVTSLVLFIASGLLSPIPDAARGVVTVGVAALLMLHVLRIVCLDFLPQRRYQIPRETFTAEPTRAAFRFAFELGSGVRTYITAAAPYAAATLLLLALPSALSTATSAVLATGVGFGVGRSMIVAIQSLRSAVAVEHPARWLRAADIVAVAVALALAVQFVIERG